MRSRLSLSLARLRSLAQTIVGFFARSWRHEIKLDPPFIQRRPRYLECGRLEPASGGYTYSLCKTKLVVCAFRPWRGVMWSLVHLLGAHGIGLQRMIRVLLWLRVTDAETDGGRLRWHWPWKAQAWRERLRLLAGAALLIFLLAPALQAQNTTKSKTAFFMERYDLDSGTPTYCVLRGAGNDPWTQQGTAGAGPVSATASTTLAETAAANDSLEGLQANDLILIRSGSTTYVRTVLDATLAPDSVVIDEAITVAAANYEYFRHDCGTGATDGWLYIGDLPHGALAFYVDQLAAVGGLNVRVETAYRGLGGGPKGALQVFPYTAPGAVGVPLNITTAGATGRFVLELDGLVADGAEYLRVGVDFGTADGATDTTTSAEHVTARLFGHYEVAR
jgi:hypothetical protein